MALTQSYDNELNGVKGWFSPYALDKTADLAATSDEFVAGRVYSLNASGNLVRGLIDNAMPLFGFSKIEGFTGAGPAGQMANLSTHMSGRFYGDQAIQGTAAERVLCLVATGGYELETTEFTDAAYAPNALLTAQDENAGATSGVVEAGTFGADTICGVVSDGTATNNFSKSVLRFWPVYLPH